MLALGNFFFPTNKTSVYFHIYFIVIDHVSLPQIFSPFTRCMIHRHYKRVFNDDAFIFSNYLINIKI